MQEDSIKKDQKMGESEHNKGSAVKTEEEVKDFLKTMITYNKGGSWRRIKAPLLGLDGKKYDCGDNCYLNLHGITGEFPPFYTVESAVGIVIANGNVGEFLSFNEDDISTFMSRDGGVTWFEVNTTNNAYN